MDILVRDLGKKFRKHWVFKGFNYHFKFGNAYAITGPNGSGKSTLLQIISGFIPATTGTLQYKNAPDNAIDNEDFYKYHTLASPYLELIEEFTLLEILQFHFNFKKISNGLSIRSVIDRLYLEDSTDKPIKYFSSGMKQRLKLGLAFYAEVPVLLLDEPTTNLDEKGIEWYHEEVTKQQKNKLMVVSSNVKNEYKHCPHIINLLDWKKI
ncbi:ATP-binding cassette domain-containing protein [Fulvivirgaceae bacterium BMA12]|uniref:ATP-binding cassette domain-containing protein n=1 Tax=Agaribacillus aureus TaxID=3051825 RepID=A0ABT8L2L9_9BACT|nr:ATP-binding cassette domain-containing protein [Fulvivirgaceae bacterium BMA12]